jgi:hypothetical protein
MSNDTAKPSESSSAGSAGSAGGEFDERAGEPQRASASEGRTAFGPEFFTDHTPPPVTVEAGSVLIETDVPITHDMHGSAAHSHRHHTGPNRMVRGLRVLNDTGKTLWLVEETEDTSIKIWYEVPSPTSPEQIFVDGATLTIEVDADLGAGVPIAHPPVPKTVQRIRQYKHPSPHAKNIKKVEVITNGQSEIFTDDQHRVDKVYIWDTPDPQ